MANQEAAAPAAKPFKWKRWAYIGGAAVIGLIAISSYNTIPKKDEAVKAAVGNMQAQYQRRNDLVGNLVSVVEAGAAHERGTLREVIEARAKATSVQIDISKASPEDIQRWQAAQGELSVALGRLMVNREAYPRLQALKGFDTLQSQLEGTENRIAVARRDYNLVCQDFNTTIRTLPGSLWNMVYGAPRCEAFQAQDGAQNAPKVEFNKK